MATYNKNLYTSSTSMINADSVYDENEELSQEDLNATLISDLNGKVSKNGDTMTGDLNLNSASLKIASGSVRADSIELDLTNLPSSSASGSSGFVLRDVGERIIGQIYPSMGAGRHGMVFRVRNNTGGTSQPLNTFGMYVHTDNTKEVWFSDPAAWRAGLDAPCLSEENTFSEIQTFLNNTRIRRSSTYAAGNTVTSDTTLGMHSFADKNNLSMGWLETVVLNGTGDVRTRVAARTRASGSSTNLNNNIDLITRQNGTREVVLSHPAAWLTALGLESTAQFSPSSWHSKVAANAGSSKKYGRIIMFNWNVKQTGAVAKSATIATFSTGTSFAWCYGLIIKNNAVLGLCHSTDNTIITDVAVPWTSGTEYFNIILNTSLL